MNDKQSRKCLTSIEDNKLKQPNITSELNSTAIITKYPLAYVSLRHLIPLGTVFLHPDIFENILPYIENKHEILRLRQVCLTAKNFLDELPKIQRITKDLLISLHVEEIPGFLQDVNHLEFSKFRISHPYTDDIFSIENFKRFWAIYKSKIRSMEIITTYPYPSPGFGIIWDAEMKARTLAQRRRFIAEGFYLLMPMDITETLTSGLGFNVKEYYIPNQGGKYCTDRFKLDILCRGERSYQMYRMVQT